MYEKDKERYEKEMKKYTSDKVPKKEPATKKSRTKTPKQKASATLSTKTSPAVAQGSPDQRSDPVVSPTLNPLSPQSLTCMPHMSLPHIPLPQLLPLAEEGSAFDDNYQELHSRSQDAFL